ncbi:hypothetical protein ACLB2K_064367 [Fragaria x ananassa]
MDESLRVLLVDKIATLKFNSPDEDDLLDLLCKTSDEQVQYTRKLKDYTEHKMECDEDETYGQGFRDAMKGVSLVPCPSKAHTGVEDMRKNARQVSARGRSTVHSQGAQHLGTSGSGKGARQHNGTDVGCMKDGTHEGSRAGKVQQASTMCARSMHGRHGKVTTCFLHA